VDHPLPAAQHQARGALRLVRSVSSDDRTPASLLPPRAPVLDLLVDDAAVAVHMVAVLHAAGSGDVSRAELADALDVPADRIEAGWAYLAVRPPTGLRVQRHAEHFRLVTDNTCAASVERYSEAQPKPSAAQPAATRGAGRRRVRAAGEPRAHR
jgi:hypothetical protein